MKEDRKKKLKIQLRETWVKVGDTVDSYLEYFDPVEGWKVLRPVIHDYPVVIFSSRTSWVSEKEI